MAAPALTRRAFIAGAAGLAAGPILTTCLQTPIRRAAGGPGGRLVVALPADPAGLDPLLQTGLVEASVYGNIFDALLTYDADGHLQPSLAESYRALDDRTWEFKLRRDVSFHDGQPFDSRSVRATIERMLDPASKSAVRAQLVAIERVDTPEPRTAIVVTRQPFAPLLAELTGLMMLPPSVLTTGGEEDLARKPVGTGPFRFVEWIRDERLVLQADPGHWRGSPGVEFVEFRPLPDAATRVAALRAGQVDLGTGLLPHSLPQLEQQGLRIAERPGTQALYVRLNARKPPLDDVRVRRAVVQAVDVDRLIEAIYAGRARRINGPFPPEVFGYDARAPFQQHDPDRARALLNAAGLTGGTTLIFEAPRGRYPGDDQVVQVLAEQLGRVGLKVEIRVLEWGAYLSKLQAGQGEHLFLLAGTNRTFDPHFTITRLYTKASPFGLHYYSKPRLDDLADQAAATLDPERRRALYAQILASLRDEAPAIWLAQLSDLYGLQPRLAWAPRGDSLLWMHEARLGD